MTKDSIEVAIRQIRISIQVMVVQTPMIKSEIVLSYFFQLQWGGMVGCAGSKPIMVTKDIAWDENGFLKSGYDFLFLNNPARIIKIGLV